VRGRGGARAAVVSPVRSAIDGSRTAAPFFVPGSAREASTDIHGRGKDTTEEAWRGPVGPRLLRAPQPGRAGQARRRRAPRPGPDRVEVLEAGVPLDRQDRPPEPVPVVGPVHPTT